MHEEYALELRNVTKRFGSVTASDHVSLNVRKHEILSVLGENGCGKTTLMNMIAGIYRPDEGQIFVNGREVSIRSPKDASALNIGMVHQHYKLVNIFTAAENLVLGQRGFSVVDIKTVKKEIKAICDAYGFNINLDQKIYEMSVSQKQTVEIVKALYRGADILILDEPTAVLTPQETESLFAVMKNMRAAGKSIIIITHKLNEVLEVSDRVTVLRKGKFIETIETKDATVERLTELMVGEKVELDIKRTDCVDVHDVLSVSNLTLLSKEGIKLLDNVSFTARSGEILGIAGISGCGSKELFEAITGVFSGGKISGGSVVALEGENQIEITGKTPDEIKKLGIKMSFVPEDRLGMGLVASLGMTDNMILRSYRDGRGPLLRRIKGRKLALKIKSILEVVTPGIEFPVRRLSGGNVQKVLVGREISSNPKILLVAYPVRGLDIHSSYAIYRQLEKAKASGCAVITIIEDLDVLIALSDRILVLNSGKITGLVDGRNTSKEKIGLLMTSEVEERK